MDLDRALSRCPFLHNICEREGRNFALSVAVNPLVTVPPGGAPRRPIVEEQEDFASTFRLFHGAAGVLPLSSKTTASVLSGCPRMQSPPTSSFAPPAIPSPDPASRATSAAKLFDAPQSVTPSQPEGVVQHRLRASPLANAPLAAMSLGMPDFGELFRRFQQAHLPPKPKPSTRKPPNNRPDVKHSATSNTSTHHGPPKISHTGPAPSSGPNPTSVSATCPMRALLGPAAGFVFNKAGNLQCPEVIIQARAALAATKPVKILRPQALPIKLIAVGAIAAAANIPCGMWREHTKKFSFQWFCAVHASIPFIAMLRKAVIMPKLAIVCTIAAAVAGQAIGARLEREAMLREAQGPVKLLLPSAASEAAEARPAAQKPAATAPGAGSRRLKVKVRSAAVAAGTARSQSLMVPLVLGGVHGQDVSSVEWRMGRPTRQQLLRLPCAQAHAGGLGDVALRAPVACK